MLALVLSDDLESTCGLDLNRAESRNAGGIQGNGIAK